MKLQKVPTRGELFKTIRQYQVAVTIGMLIIILGISGILYSVYPLKVKQTDIKFHGLNASQITSSLKLIDEVKPLYLQVQKSITFTNNISSECSDCAGVNQNRNIVVLYSDNLIREKKILCHEMLHTFIYKAQEDIVYDLDDFLPRYKSPESRKVWEDNGVNA